MKEAPAAIVAPHAGYHYSGQCAAHAYAQVDVSELERVVLLGPSHNAHFEKCAIPPGIVIQYDTPLGPLQLDTPAIEALRKQSTFSTSRIETDEAEHSLELHLPYIKHLLDLSGNSTARLLPIMVGNISKKDEAKVGKTIERYLSDPKSLVVISTDFCHWGKRFGFFWHDEQRFKSVAESVEALDALAIDIVRKQDPAAFAEYISMYKATICGKHPLAVLLHSLNASSSKFSVRMLNYDRSNTPKSFEDSSVSYVAAAVHSQPAQAQQAQAGAEQA